jgi:TctA family transporter
MFEQSLRQPLIISKHDPGIFFTRPISASLLALAIGSLAWVLWSQRKKRNTDNPA